MARKWYQTPRRFLSEYVLEWRGVVFQKNGTWRAYLANRNGESMISPGIYKTVEDAKVWCNIRLTEIHERKKIAAENDYKQWYRDEMRRTRRSQDTLKPRRDKLDGSSDGRMYRDGGHYGSSTSFDDMDDESDS